MISLNTAGTLYAGPGNTRHVLENGLVVIIQEDHKAPLVSLQAWIRAGSITEGAYMGTGISHFVEHMLFKGTEKRGLGEIAKQIGTYGGSLGGYTSFDHTVYYINLPSRNLDRAIEILEDALKNPVFDKNEVNREREVILKEIMMNDDDPQRRLGNLFWRTLFRVHPYAHPVIGYKERFLQIKREDLIKYHRKMYVPDNTILVVAGDISSSAVLDSIKRVFSAWPRGAARPEDLPREPEQMIQRLISEEFPVELAHIAVGYIGPDIFSEDMPAMELTAVILGEGRSSRLYQELREKDRLVYDIDGWHYSLKGYGVLGIDITTEPGKREEVLLKIRENIRDLENILVDRQELDKAKKRIRSDYIFQQEKVAARARSFGWGELQAGEPLFWEDFIQRIDKVEPEDIRRVVRKYMTPEKEVVVSLLPRGVLEGKEIPPAPRAADGIKKDVLDNGITLLIKEDKSGLVGVRMILLGSVLNEKAENNGISNLMCRTMLKGTKKRTAKELAWDVESRGAGIGAYAGYNSMGFSVKALKEDWLFALDILHEIVLEPAFDPEEIEKERAVILSEIRSLDEDIWSRGNLVLRKTFFMEHPYSFLETGTEESLKNINRDDIVSWWKDSLRSGRAVLTVFGEIDAAEVERAVKERFSAVESLKTDIRSPVAIAHSRREDFYEMEKEQILVFWAFPGLSIYDEEKYAMEVLNDILNGLSGRLFSSLRDKEALAYMLGSFHLSGLDPGAFVFYIATSPGNKDKAIRLFTREIEKLKKNLVEKEELERAKIHLIEQMARTTETNMGLSLHVGLDELYGLGYETYLDYAGCINKVTAEEIRELVRKKFIFNESSIIVAGAKE